MPFATGQTRVPLFARPKRGPNILGALARGTSVAAKTKRAAANYSWAVREAT